MILLYCIPEIMWNVANYKRHNAQRPALSSRNVEKLIWREELNMVYKNRINLTVFNKITSDFVSTFYLLQWTILSSLAGFFVNWIRSSHLTVVNFFTKSDKNVQTVIFRTLKLLFNQKKQVGFYKNNYFNKNWIRTCGVICTGM